MEVRMQVHGLMIFLMWARIWAQRGWAGSGEPTQTPRTRRGEPGGRTKAPGKTASREWEAETKAGEPTGRMSVFSRLNLEPIILEVSVRQEPMAGRSSWAETNKLVSSAYIVSLAGGRGRRGRPDVAGRRRMPGVSMAEGVKRRGGG